MFRIIEIIMSVGFVTLQFGVTGLLMRDTKAHTNAPSDIGIEFGKWAGFIHSAPNYRSCTVRNGIFSFQLFADGQKRFGATYPAGVNFISDEFKNNSKESIFSVYSISSRHRTYYARTLGVYSSNDAANRGPDDVVIDDPRLTVQVRSSESKIWVDPVVLFDFLKTEHSVTVLYLPIADSTKQKVDTSQFSNIIDWCNAKIAR